LMMRARTREDVRGDSGGGSGKRKEGGYFAAWRRALGKRGAHDTGLTLRRQIENLTDPPDFSKELVRYHYAVSYEGHPVDMKRERRLEKEIHKWENP
jgi:hypothetical protein